MGTVSYLKGDEILYVLLSLHVFSFIVGLLVIRDASQRLSTVRILNDGLEQSVNYTQLRNNIKVTRFTFVADA